MRSGLDQQLTLGKYIVFQHFSHSTPAPSALIHLPSSIRLLHFVHVRGRVLVRLSVASSFDDIAGVVRARTGSLGDLVGGDSGNVLDGGDIGSSFLSRSVSITRSSALEIGRAHV